MSSCLKCDISLLLIVVLPLAFQCFTLPEKREISDIFQALNLGTVVEEKMKEFALSCNYEQ